MGLTALRQWQTAGSSPCWPRPPLGFLVQRHASRMRGRAHGEDSLPPDFYRLFPWSTANALFQVMLRAGLRMGEPLSSRGGMNTELWKGKGSTIGCEAHREINISDTNAKD